MAADVESGKKVAEMADSIANLQESAQVEQLSPKAIQEMQTQLEEKRLLVQTVLEEIKQDMPFVKELQARASKNDEDAILQIKALQEKMKESKETLEKAVKEMEEIGANMREIQSQAHD